MELLLIDAIKILLKIFVCIIKYLFLTHFIKKLHRNVFLVRVDTMSQLLDRYLD